MATLNLRPETVAVILAEADARNIQVDLQGDVAYLYPACPFDTEREVWALCALGRGAPVTLRWHDEVRR